MSLSCDTMFATPRCYLNITIAIAYDFVQPLQLQHHQLRRPKASRDVSTFLLEHTCSTLWSKKLTVFVRSVDLRVWLGVYYFLSLTLSVCCCVCHGQTSNWFFFFVYRWNRAIYWLSVLHDPQQNVFFDFWFSPPDAQYLLPKICTKSPITWFVWQIDRRFLHQTGGFWGWPMQ